MVFSLRVIPDIRGTVALDGAGLAGVTTLGLPVAAVTGSSGQYFAGFPRGWSGTVTPVLAGYSISPRSRSYDNLPASLTAEDYAASACQTIAVSPVTLPAAVVGSSYSAVLSQSGGIGGVTWSLAGAPPSWLTLDPVSGTLTGTPPHTGSFSFTAFVIDSTGCGAARPYTLAVVCPSIQVGPPSVSPPLKAVCPTRRPSPRLAVRRR